LIYIKEVLLFRVLFQMRPVLERTMAQTIISYYLERRYAALESEIADALRQSPTDDLAIADLKHRKLIIADEIQHDRRLVERFSKLSLLLG
jgi:hypothetical protein